MSVIAEVEREREVVKRIKKLLHVIGERRQVPGLYTSHESQPKVQQKQEITAVKSLCEVTLGRKPTGDEITEILASRF